MSGTLRWVRRHCIQHSDKSAEEWATWPTWPPSVAKETVERAITKREINIRTTGYRPRASTLEYVRSGYRSLCKARIPHDALLVWGISWLIRFRMNVIASAQVLRTWDKLPLAFQRQCPCCAEPVLEDRLHIILHCALYQDARERHLADVLRRIILPPRPPLEETLNEEWAAMSPEPDLDLSDHDRMVLLLGGNTPARPMLTEWPPPRTEDYLSDRDEESVDSESLEDELSSSSDGSLLSVEALPEQGRVPFQSADALRVAAFLSEAMSLRQRHLRGLPQWPQTAVTPPLRTPGQRPAG